MLKTLIIYPSGALFIGKSLRIGCRRPREPNHVVLTITLMKIEEHTMGCSVFVLLYLLLHIKSIHERASATMQSFTTTPSKSQLDRKMTIVRLENAVNKQQASANHISENPSPFH